jgi:hypothetical protein
VGVLHWVRCCIKYIYTHICHILLLAEPLYRTQYASGRSCDRPSRRGFSWFSSVFKHP